MNSANNSARAAYDMALEATRQGRFPQAEGICREILRALPRHGDSWVLLGVIELQTARPAQAVGSLRNALELDGSQAVSHALLGDALLESNRPAQALDAYEAALRLDPGLIPAALGRGNALLDMHHPAEAVTGFDQVLTLQRDHPEAWFGRGNALLGDAKHAAAIESYDRAIALKPGYAAYSNRGSALLSLHRPEAALASFDAALSLNAHGVEALRGRGDALLQLGRPEEALAAHDRVVMLTPKSAAAHDSRGNALRALRRMAQAVDSYDAALRLEPHNAALHFNRGDALLDRGLTQDALASFEQAIALRPDFAAALRARGDALLAMQKPAAAAQSYRALLRSSPAADYAHGALLHAEQCAAEWSAIVVEDRERVRQAVLAGDRVASPFAFLSLADSPAAQLQCAKTFVAARASGTPLPARGARQDSERLRLAYLSPDFRAHAVSYLMAGVFESHDRRRFETLAISLRPEEPSPMGQRVKRAFERFIDVSAMHDREIANLMQALQVDIVVDLVGYTDGMRPGILAFRPAPLQVSYLGFPATTGAAYVDYLIADAYVIPPSQRPFYSEQVVTLPDCFQANDVRREISGRTATRAEAGLPDAGFVFCCFNNTYKINPAMFDIWMRLLGRTPDSVLWLFAAEGAARTNLAGEASRRGIDARRLVFASRVPYADHLRRLALADLFLDTMPFNAGTTASDALWAGLPLLTCAGQSYAARMAGSLLRTAGLPELVTGDLAGYETEALRLARHRDELAGLRERLLRNRHGTPLFDTVRLCRHLESAYETMWQRHQQGLGPADFAVMPES